MPRVPVPPGYEELLHRMISEMRPDEPPAAPPQREGRSWKALEDPGLPDIARPKPNVDASLLSKTLEEKTGLFQAMREGIQDPSQWGPAAGQFAKGALSGATLGASEFIEPLKPDPESWAASAGELTGFAVPGMGAAKGVAKAAKILPKAIAGAVGSPLGSNVVSGAILAPADVAIRDKARGVDEERNYLGTAAVGAAIPVAGHLVAKGIGKMLGKGAAEIEPSPIMQKNRIEALAPDMQAAYKDYIKKPDLPMPSSAPMGGYYTKNAQAVTGMGEDVSIAGFREPNTVAYTTNRGTFEFSRPENIRLKQPGTPEMAQGGAAVVPHRMDVQGPPEIKHAMKPSSGAIAPPGGASPPLAPSGETVPASIWEQGLETVKHIGRKFNLPIRVLGRDPQTQPVMKSLFGFADRLTQEELAMERQLLGATQGWTTQMKKYHAQTWLANQGADPTLVKQQLAQFPGTAAQKQALLAGDDALRNISNIWRQRAVDYGYLTPEQVIEQHLPFMRYRAITPGEIKVEIDNSPRTVGYMSSWLQEHPRGKSFMFKTRNQADVPERTKDLSFDELWSIKIKGLARAFAFKDEVVLGGQGPGGIVGQSANGKPIYWIDQMLNRIQDPVKKDYAVRLVNHAAGNPKDSWLAQNIPGGMAQANQLAAAARRLQFNHLITGNFLTPLINLTQSLVTLSRVSTSNWGKAWKLAVQNSPHQNYIDPGTGEAMIPRRFAEKILGASGTFNKADEELIKARLMGSETLGKMAYQFARPFRFSEKTNQWHASLAGYEEGLSRGMNQAEAIDFAKGINRYTQQFGGIVNTPSAFQGPGGSMIGQFKSYPIGYWGFVKDLFSDAGKGINMMLKGQGETFNPIIGTNDTALGHVKPLIKYMLAIGALGGPTAVFGPEVGGDFTAAVREKMDEVLPEWAKGGFLGYVGADMSNQLGFGSLPFSSLQELGWFLPGPALSNVMDGITVVSYIADTLGINKDLTPETDPRRGVSIQSGLEGVSPDDVVSRAMRSFFPFGGPQLDRVRKYVKTWQTGGNEVEGLSILQALGWEVPSGNNIRSLDASSPMGGHLGIPPELEAMKMMLVNPTGRGEDIQRRGEMVESGKAYSDALRTYHTLVAGGQTMQAQQFADNFYKRTGMNIIPSRQALDAAYQRRAVPSSERMLRRAPWPVEVQRRLDDLDR